MGSFGYPLILRLPETSFISKFPWSLNLPLINLVWSTFFFVFSLPSLGEDYNPQIIPRKLPREAPEDVATQQLVNLSENEEIGFGKEVSEVETLLGPYVRPLWPVPWVQRCPENAGCFNVFVWGTLHCALWPRRKINGHHGGMVGWPLVSNSAGHQCSCRGWDSS